VSKLNGNSTNIPSGKVNAIKVAKSWLTKGIQPVPLTRRSKKPKGKKGWNKLMVTHDTIPQFFSTGDNVGGLWGEPSGWIVDVDLDWDEASLAAPRLFPETFVYGRRKRPGSHYLFQVTGVAGSKRYDSGQGDNAARSVITEIRASGSQSVLPPSIHPEGDRYEINHDVEIKSLTPKGLERLVDQVSAAALFARYYPARSGRHDYIHAIAGALLWESWQDDDVRKFSLAVLDAVDAKENDRKQRERTIENTITHFRQGNRIAGWKTLSQWMHGRDIELIKSWLRSTKKFEVVQVGFKPKPLIKEQEDIEELCQIPGIVGDITKWAGQRAFLKQPIFNLSVGLMCTALLSMNRYNIENWDTPLQPYFMLLAPTSGGKESAMESVYLFAKKLGLGDHVFQGFQSYHSMLDKLATPPNVAVWLWDEAARKMRTANRSQGGQDFSILTWLLSLYGRANSSSPGLPGRKNTIAAIENPFFLTMAASQPAQMLEAITDSDIAQGLVNRFVLFDSGDRMPEANLERTNLFPSKFEEFSRIVRSIGTPTNGTTHFRKVKFDNMHVWNQFRNFDEEARKNAFYSDNNGVWGRANQNALILAGLVAVGVNPKNPHITEEIATWATKFTRWSVGRWKRRVDESSSRTVVEQRSKAVEKYIQHVREFAHRAKQPNLAALMTDGLMPRSMLTRLCRHLSSRDLDDVLAQLTVADLVATGEVKNTEVFWHKQD
jgi:hypothetical protein